MIGVTWDRDKVSLQRVFTRVSGRVVPVSVRHDRPCGPRLQSPFELKGLYYTTIKVTLSSQYLPRILTESRPVPYSLLPKNFEELE